MLYMVDNANNIYFLEKFKVSPAEATILLSYPNLAWSPKILYGIFVDSFSICSSRAKAYVIICGLMQCASALMIATIPWGEP